MTREGGAVARVRAAPPGRVTALIPEVAGRLGGQAAFEHGFDHLGDEAAIPGQRELAEILKLWYPGFRKDMTEEVQVAA